MEERSGNEMSSRTFTDMAAEVLTFDRLQLDFNRVLWFCRSALDVSTFPENSCALSVGASLDSLSECQPFFSRFPAVFLAMPEGGVRDALAEAISEHCPCIPVLLPRAGAFGDRQSVEDVVTHCGITAADRLLEGAFERPLHTILDVADIAFDKLETKPSVLSGIRELDASIGGFYGGELSVWTGKRGCGKSTLLGQLILEAVQQGHRAFCYSGELSASQFKNWIFQQAAGGDYIKAFDDPYTGKTFWTVDSDAQRRIAEWMRGKLFLFDNAVSSGSDDDGLFATMRYAVQRYGCAVVVLDNLMSVHFSASRENDFYRQQSAFVGRLVEFAQRYGVHIHLVCHPRKSGNSGGSISDADDVGGSGDITNRAHNVFALQRLTPEQVEEQGYDAVLRVLKNRNFGISDAFSLDYDPHCRRFQKSGSNDVRHYGWEV